MPVPGSGAISLNDFHVEAGGTSGTQASINDADIRGLIGKSAGAQMSFSEWYGASATQAFTTIKSGHRYYTYTGGRGSTQYGFAVGFNAPAGLGPSAPPSGSISYTGDIVVSGTTLGTIAQVSHCTEGPIRAQIVIKITGTNSNSGWTTATFVSTATNGVTYSINRTAFNTYSYANGQRQYFGFLELASATTSWGGNGSTTNDSHILGPTTGNSNGTGTESSFTTTLTFS